jgi:methionyl-tRNA synthetase
MTRTSYHTTPIYYVNDVPHVGHAYCTVALDALTRARRLLGQRVFFLTGTDEHGQNIERIAREKGLSPQEHTDRIAAVFRDLWARLDVAYDGFIRTTDERHKRGVLRLWSRLREARTPDGSGAVYRGKYSGWYCPRCEAFKTEDELKQPGNVCPDHERPCEWTEEENFFFRLSAYQGWLDDAIRSGEIRIEPETRRNEVLAVIRQGLQDFSISRARVKWGIPVPEEPGHVFYVWMDALANYITALGYAEHGDDYRVFWEEADERLHLVGKEIIRFHCLYWPAMLKAAGAPVPTRVFAHGHLTKGGRKLSKTTGNVIDPQELSARLGPDAFRYFFLREGSFAQDWDFTDEAYTRRYNSDLANDLGNLVSRTLTMVQRYCEGKVPGMGAQILPLDPGRVLDRYEALDFGVALGLVWEAVGKLNQRIVTNAPWEMAKDPAQRDKLGWLLYDLLEGVRLIATLVYPVMPRAATRIYAMLGLEGEPGPQDLQWGRLQPGRALGRLEPLFPRIEASNSKEDAVSDDKPPTGTAGDKPPTGTAGDKPPTGTAGDKPVPAPAERPTPPPVETTQAAPPPAGDRIDISEFARVELRAAKVTAAERVQGSKKLLKLQVDLGSESRQVVAGIAEAYAPEALVGKTVVVVANLKPAKLMGQESNGMVLAGSLDGRPVLCTFDGDVPPGTKVK